MSYQAKSAYLILQDGTVFKGKSIGAEGKAVGEVQFSTAMVGYQEALTDPANYGALLAQTFPLIGNYGINVQGNESGKIYLNGYIVREICDKPSNFSCTSTLDEFLKENGVVGISDIDTRKLTRLIRDKGVMNGMITTIPIIEDMKPEIAAFSVKNAVPYVSTKETKIFKASVSRHNITMVDFGVKKSLIEAFTARGCNVTLVPYNTPTYEIQNSNPDAIVLTDGAGDPSENAELIQTVKELAKLKIPMLGVGLGHHLIAIAKGAKVVKMHCGHRGANQPVFCLADQKTYITVQNHGYVVDESTIDITHLKVTYKNANDKTCEGIKYNDAPIFSVQFTPDNAKTMVSTSFVYDELIEMMA